MSGAEIAKLLQAACADAGLDQEATRRVLLSFTLRWGEQIGAELDLAMWAGELKNSGS